MKNVVKVISTAAGEAPYVIFLPLITELPVDAALPQTMIVVKSGETVTDACPAPAVSYVDPSILAAVNSVYVPPEIV